MIDNLKEILPLLVFQEGHFYEVMILQRKKDNPEAINRQNVRLIKHYIVDSLDYLMLRYDEMKTLADTFNARVYIKLGSYSKEKLGFKILETLSHKLINQDLKFSNLVSKSIGNMNPSTKYWIVDVDFKDVTENEILRIKTLVKNCSLNGNNIITEVPAPNGINLICLPFNLNDFIIYQDVYYKCKIHKNNPTILYSNVKKSY
jgi:hypothetical protein